MSENAYVLLLDLVGSSQLPDRQAATERVQAAQRVVNERFESEWLAPLETTRGDETAAVLSRAGAAYDVISGMADEIHPLNLRAVLEYGNLVAGLDTRRASIIDGPAFNKADQQMESLKGSARLCHFATGLPAVDPSLNAVGNLLLDRLTDLTELQRRILRQYQAKRQQKAVGRIVARSQQQVSTTLQAIRWELIDDAEETMRGLLSEVDMRRRESEEKR